jgi:NitT/TauT family transport system ATP-binding protein
VSEGAVVTLRGVGKTFRNGTLALEGLDLEVRRGEFLTVLGPSGCGKSSALRIIAGLSDPTTGIVEWTEGPTDPSRRIGFVFQEATLMPWATVADNVRLPFRLDGLRAEETEARVARMLEHVGLEGFGDVYPRELSGGMKMRGSRSPGLW